MTKETVKIVALKNRHIKSGRTDVQSTPLEELTHLLRELFGFQFFQFRNARLGLGTIDPATPMTADLNGIRVKNCASNEEIKLVLVLPLI